MNNPTNFTVFENDHRVATGPLDFGPTGPERLRATVVFNPPQ